MPGLPTFTGKSLWQELAEQRCFYCPCPARHAKGSRLFCDTHWKLRRSSRPAQEVPTAGAASGIEARP